MKNWGKIKSKKIIRRFKDIFKYIFSYSQFSVTFDHCITMEFVRKHDFVLKIELELYKDFLEQWFFPRIISDNIYFNNTKALFDTSIIHK